MIYNDETILDCVNDQLLAFSAFVMVALIVFLLINHRSGSKSKCIKKKFQIMLLMLFINLSVWQKYFFDFSVGTVANQVDIALRVLIGIGFFLVIHFVLKKASKSLAPRIRQRFYKASRSLYISGLVTTGVIMIFMEYKIYVGNLSDSLQIDSEILNSLDSV